MPYKQSPFGQSRLPLMEVFLNVMSKRVVKVIIKLISDSSVTYLWLCPFLTRCSSLSCTVLLWVLFVSQSFLLLVTIASCLLLDMDITNAYIRRVIRHELAELPVRREFDPRQGPPLFSLNQNCSLIAQYRLIPEIFF